MSYLPKPNEGSFELPPAGTFPAVCTRIIDLGTQQTTYKGQPKQTYQVMLSWEIADDDAKMSDGKRFMTSQRYTWSMSEKANLRKHLEAWRGQAFTDADFGEGGFNLKNVLGKACLLQIVHEENNGKTYANIASLMKMPKGMPVPTAESELIYLWLDPDLFDREAFGKLSDYMQELIKKAPEYSFALSTSKTQPEHIAGGMDDEIPF
jgi:hypothetical protein